MSKWRPSLKVATPTIGPFWLTHLAFGSIIAMLPMCCPYTGVLNGLASQIGVLFDQCIIRDKSTLSLNLILPSLYSQIIMMLADDMACNPRNPRPGELEFNKGTSNI
jgi:hypothetical protein